MNTSGKRKRQSGKAQAGCGSWRRASRNGSRPAAADAGHQVSLYEKEEYLGGEFALAPVPPSREIWPLLAWEQRQLQKRELTFI